MSQNSTLHSSIRRRFLLLSIFVVCMCFPGIGLAQSQQPVRVGFNGNIRLGKWTPIFIDAQSNPDAVRFEAQVLDGDDTPVVYCGPLLTDPERPDVVQAWTRNGRTYGGAELRLFDSADNMVNQIDIPLAGDGRLVNIHRSTQEMILTLEPGQIFQEAIESVSAITSMDNMRSVTSVGMDGDLPLNWIGYDGVELVVLVTSDSKRIEQLTDLQLSALQAWVEKGGTLILSAAANGQQLLEPGGKLARFCPGKFRGLGECKNSSRLETYCDSREQLIELRGKSIPIVELDSITGRVLVDDGKSKALVTRGMLGLGQVVFVSFDLDSPRITQWSGFRNLISRLVAQSEKIDGENSVQRSSRGNSVSHFGYQDIIGQLRVPLDRFSKVKFVKFALIAALIGLYILCIGPGDYFLLKNVFKKMELTWLTFPLVSLLFCGLAVGISRMTRPTEIQLNQLEIIDLDSVNGEVRGSVWTNLYSPNGNRCSLDLDPAHTMGFEIDSELISWHGLPGDGLGGMMTTANPGLLKRDYRLDFEIGANGQDIKTKLDGLPLQVSSTKPLYTQWWAKNPVRIRSRLKLDRRTQQINGVVTNPFDFPLKNVRLVFENWAYLLDEPLKAGSSFDIRTETQEKTLKSLLTRKVKQSKSDRSDNSPWDPTEIRVNRIADMMMFYDAAGGLNYTGLTNSYQPIVDMSDLVDLKRAVLVAEVDQPGAIFRINGEDATQKYDNVTTIVRVVFPVDYLDDRDSN